MQIKIKYFDIDQDQLCKTCYNFLKASSISNTIIKVMIN